MSGAFACLQSDGPTATRDPPDPAITRYARALVAHAPTDEAGLRTWVFALMHHAYVSTLRARHAASQLDAGPEAVPPGQNDFEQAIAALSPEQREVFLLVSLEDFSYDQGASTLGIPAGTERVK